MNTRFQKTSARLAEVAAKHSTRLLPPRAVFRLTGVVPWVESPEAPRTLTELEEPARFEAPTPREEDGRATWVRSRDRGADSARLSMVEGGIALSTGAVLDGLGRFHSSLSHDFDFLDRPGRSFRRFVPEPHRLLPSMLELSEVVCLTASNQGFYFHWLFDVLPRLHLADRAGFGDGPFFVEAEQPFQRESLEMLDVLDRCVVTGPGRSAVCASRLLVPCHRIAPGRVVPAWVVEFLRARLLSRVEASPRHETRLYVSRRRAGHRRILNEPEAIRLLSEHGFVSVELESLRLEEQIRLFRGADMIVAPHGGGLANLVFCRPGTRVLELFPATNIDLYYRLATRLGLDYRHLKSEDGRCDAMGPEHYRVDLGRLKTAVEAALCAVAQRG